MYLNEGVAEKHGVSFAAMKEMIEATIKANEKRAREDKAEDRRREQRAEKKQSKDRREEDRTRREQERARREEARAQKEEERKSKARVKEFEGIAKLPRVEHEMRLAELAKRLGEDIELLRDEFAAFFVPDDDTKIEPWPEPVATRDLLTEITKQIRRYVVTRDDGAIATSLWTMFAWVHELAVHSPILVITSAEKDSGKTTLLGVLNYLTPRPYPTVEMTGPGLFHIVDYARPTLIVDEADKLFHRRNDLLHVINSGWTRGTKITRIVRGFPREFDPFCPKIIGLKGLFLPDTLASRGIIVTLLPKTDAEKIANFAFSDDAEFETLRRKLTRWSSDNASKLKVTQPALPLGFNNRLAANWKLLFAIAELANCGEQARRAAVAITSSRRRNQMSEGIRLLASLQKIFASHAALSSADIVRKLVADKDAEWCEYRGSASITQRQVALLLDAHDIHPGVIHPTKGSSASARGYKAAQFVDVFARYLPNNRTTVQLRRKGRGK